MAGKGGKSAAPAAAAGGGRSSSDDSLSDVSDASLSSLLSAALVRQTHYNLMVACVVLFCAEAARGLFIPSLWATVQNMGLDRSFLSWCIPIFSIGRMFGSYAAGRLSDRWDDDGLPTVGCIVASMIGAAVYVVADMSRSAMLLLVAEFGMGLGGGTLAVLRAHASKITTDADRMSHMTYISTAQFVGLGLMPLAALAINFWFVGTTHHEAHLAALGAAEAALAAASAGVADAMANKLSSSASISASPSLAHSQQSSPSPLSGVEQSGLRGHYHAGLENRNRGGYRVTDVHAAKSPQGDSLALAPTASRPGRGLLSVSQGSGLAVTAGAAAGLAPATTAAAAAISEQADSLFSRLVNHRTAPALLLILLNVGCLALYAVYFDAGHQSAEYQRKKREEHAKKALAARVKQAQQAGEYDVDDEASGNASAFDRPVHDDEQQRGEASSRAPKELIFDVSKLEGLSFGAPSAASSAEDDSSASNEQAADGAASSSAAPAVSVHTVRDTTVITLRPFGDNADAAAPVSSAGSLNDSSPPRASRSRKGGKVASSASVPSSDLHDSASFVVEVVRAVWHLFRPPVVDSPKGKSINDAAGDDEAGGSSQAARIRRYESGRAHVDLDSEGVMLGPLRLTPDRMIVWGSCLFVFLNYVIRGVLATVETVGTPTLARFRHIPPGSPLEVEASAEFFGVLGLLGCVVFFLQWYFQDYVDEPTNLIAGFVVTVIGSTTILVYRHSEEWFVFGCVCIWSFGLPAVQNSVLAALSRILGTRPQGTWMGWIQTFGSLGRVTFPLLIKISSTEFAFFVSSLGCAIAIVALLVYMKLVKMTM